MKYLHSNFEHEFLERTHPNVTKSKVWHQKTLPNTLNNQVCTIYRIFEIHKFWLCPKSKICGFWFSTLDMDLKVALCIQLLLLHG